jgi:hypothetical protein
MKEADRSSAKETWEPRRSGEQIVNARSAADPSPETSQQERFSLLTAIEWTHLGGD